MVKPLSELKHEIMRGDHSKEKWDLLDQEVKDAFASASEQEIRTFVDCGAGEILDMIVSGYNNEE